MMRLAALCLCLAGAPAAADLLDAGSTSGWGYDPRSAFTFRGQAIGVGEPDSDEALSGRWVSFEALSTLAPNMRLQYRHTDLYARGAQADYLAGETLSSLDRYDATFYYELSASRTLSLDLGLNLRYLSANLVHLDPAMRREHSIDAYIPMVYAKALFELPFRGLSAGFEGSTSQYDENQALDYEAKLAYELNGALGLQGGWRHQRLRLDERDAPGAGFESQGPFVDFYFRF